MKIIIRKGNIMKKQVVGMAVVTLGVVTLMIGASQAEASRQAEAGRYNCPLQIAVTSVESEMTVELPSHHLVDVPGGTGFTISGKKVVYKCLYSIGGGQSKTVNYDKNISDVANDGPGRYIAYYDGIGISGNLNDTSGQGSRPVIDLGRPMSRGGRR